MTTIYDGSEWNPNTGESYVNTISGDCCGVDYMGLYTQGGNFHSYAFINDPSEYVNGIAWMYYYNIVNLSNYLITNISATSDNPGDTVEELLFIKASALTMRAHAYTRLLGYFGNRWEDSDNGEVYSIVMRTEPGTGESPLVKMNDVLNLIYSDCDEACKLFDMSGGTRNGSYEVNKNVACGIWARAALIKHDWQTAVDKAKIAREGTSIMDEKELFSGFAGDNSETIWSMNPNTDGIGTWSWGYRYACNGHYVSYWNRGGGAINIDLYNATDPKDIRRRFFWMPDHLAEVPKSFRGAGNLKEKDFWNPELVSYDTQDAYLWMNQGPKYNRKTKKGGMIEALAWWMYNYYQNYFTGEEKRNPTMTEIRVLDTYWSDHCRHTTFSTELKNVILFDNLQVPHYNYVGDSILGYKSHMGAGSITSNVKSDKTDVVIKNDEEKLETGIKKIGAMLGDFVEVGCNSVLNPGTVIGRNSNIYPTSCVRGVVPANSIYKVGGTIVAKK